MGNEHDNDVFVRQAKHDFSMHQDNLFWSRIETLIAVQGGILAGSYALGQENILLALPLVIAGAFITILLFSIAERDQLMRDQAFRESKVPPTEIVAQWHTPFRGRSLVRAVFIMLLIADLCLSAYLICQKAVAPPGGSNAASSGGASGDVRK